MSVRWIMSLNSKTGDGQLNDTRKTDADKRPTRTRDRHKQKIDTQLSDNYNTKLIIKYSEKKKIIIIMK